MQDIYKYKYIYIYINSKSFSREFKLKYKKLFPEAIQLIYIYSEVKNKYNFTLLCHFPSGQSQQVIYHPRLIPSLGHFP